MSTQFDQFIDRCRDTFNSVVQKGSELTDLAGIKMRKSALKGDLNDAYARLGQVFYQQQKFGADNLDDVVTAATREIDEIIEKIADCENQEQNAKTGGRCPRCGERMVKDAHYCVRCGYGAQGSHTQNTTDNADPNPYAPNPDDNRPEQL